MINKISLITLILASLSGSAQNLIPNGSFEQYSSCPNGTGGELDSVFFWFNPNTGSPDYFNQCAAGTNSGVPTNSGGYQLAQNGVAYTGIYLWYLSGINVREYLAVPVTNSLVSGTCYHFEMYVNAPNIVDYTTDAIGAYFSDTIIDNVPNPFVLTFTPQISNTTGFFDTLSWRLVSGNFTAAGGESYLVIGNFKDDASSATMLINNNNFQFAYCYIDNVSLTVCTGVDELNNSKTTYQNYPNPFNAHTVIPVPPAATNNQLIVLDVTGRTVKTIPIYKEISISIDGNSLSPGTYYYYFTGNNLHTKYKMLLIK